MKDIFDFTSNLADGVVAVDREQRIVFWNDAAETLLGFKAEDVLGRLCYEVLGGRDGSGCLVCHEGCRDLTMAVHRERVPNCDLLVRTKNGQEVWVSVSTVVVASRWRDVCVLVHLFRDVSREKALEGFVKELLASVAKFSLRGRTDLPMSLPVSLPSLNLTDRERQVLRLLASGASTSGIADRLSISPSTVRNHINNVLAKLKVRSRVEAVCLALRSGLA